MPRIQLSSDQNPQLIEYLKPHLTFNSHPDTPYNPYGYNMPEQHIPTSFINHYPYHSNYSHSYPPIAPHLAYASIPTQQLQPPLIHHVHTTPAMNPSAESQESISINTLIKLLNQLATAKPSEQSAIAHTQPKPVSIQKDHT